MTKPAIETQVDGSHYKDRPVQPWEVIGVLARRRAKHLLIAVDEANSIEDARLLLSRALEDFYYEGNQVKYVMRDGTKEVSKNDYDKAVHYGLRRLDIITDQQFYIAVQRNLVRTPEVLTAHVAKEAAEVAAKILEIKNG